VTQTRPLILFAAMAILIAGTGQIYGWNLALTIVNMGLISAVMALGVNLQWGYAGLFNTGIMGFVALGGLAVVLVNLAPVTEVWSPSGLFRIILGLVMGALTIVGTILLRARMAPGRARGLVTLGLLVGGFFLYRWVFDGGVLVVEDYIPATYSNFGGLGLPVLFAWPAGALIAAGAAWLVGKTALGLRSDYLAIATLGIAEIVIAVLKNEDWLTRGVKNIINIDRPTGVPYEVDLQADPSFVDRATSLGLDPVTASTLYVKLAYGVLFALVLVLLLVLAQRALNSPWGRMIRAIRDNEVAAEAMGKDVTRRHLQIFVLGSAICGLAGAMMTTLDGQLTPGTYNPLRFTFLVWVMVIVGGSGNNWGSVLGAMLIWWLWVMVEPMGLALMSFITSLLPEESALREHLADGAAHMRLLTMGIVLLLVLRFSPRGLLPER
jgi:branched-chain amino acid transport system permease protein